MNTVITNTTGNTRVRGWVFYDGECRVCLGFARRAESLLARHHFALAPLQAPRVRERLGLTAGAPLSEMRLLTADGGRFGGAEALARIAQGIWWAWPFYALAQLPGVMRVLRTLYAWLAERRHCVDGACSLPRRADGLAWWPLAVLPALALSLRAKLEPWAFMWALAFALFIGCKWLTWRRAVGKGTRPRWTRSLGYLLCWPGMDAAAFRSNLSQGSAAEKPGVREWWWALAKTIFGAAVTWGCVRLVVAEALLAGWTGLIGLVFLLHFGLFHLLALAWKRAGVHAAPIMRLPALATSLADFWGRRWNVAFHLLVHDLVFRPLRGWCGRSGALLAVFILSGLVHELVISVPARGGYGLPTAYFTLQGLAMAFERSSTGRRLGLGAGWRGWLFTILLTAGPAFWLFHPPFVHRVILPFLRAIGGN